MILNRSTLQNSLSGLVGCHQTLDPEYPTILPSLLTSRSARYWNDECPLLKIEVIDQSITNYNHFNYTAYSGATTYTLGDKVSSGGVNYEYINSSSSSGNTPPNATYWRVIDSLNDYLIQLDYKSTDMTIDSVFNHKKIKGQVKSVLNNVQLYSGRDEYDQTETNSSKFVGLRLTLKNHRGLVSILHKVGSQFNGAVTFDLYLFHSSQPTAIATFEVAHATANASKWTSLSNQVLRFLSDTDAHDIGGDWYLGYFQDDLSSVKAVKKDIRWDIYQPMYDIKKDFNRYSDFMDVVGFSFQSSDLNGTNLPDIDKVSLDYFSNYGLNLQFTTKCDLTPFIIEQEDILSEVKSLNMALLVLRDIAYNYRSSNAIANQVRTAAKRELYQHKEAWGTVMDRLTKATKALDFDLSGLNTACLPCNDALSVTFGSY